MQVFTLHSACLFSFFGWWFHFFILLIFLKDASLSPEQDLLGSQQR